MKRTSDGIIIDQDHYVNSIELPDMEVARGQIMTDILNEEGQKLYRGHVSRVLHLGYQSRPDVCVEAKCLSSKFGKKTKSDLKSALKRMVRPVRARVVLQRAR